MYATVQKLLDRLDAKGFVRRDRSGAGGRLRGGRRSRGAYRPEATGRGRLALRRSLTPLLTHLVEGDGSPRRIAKDLRSLIERLDRKRRGSTIINPEW